jgi:hypothetical protein
MDGCSDVSCTPGSWSAVTDRAGPHPIPRAQYFFDHRQELRLDARNIRLRGPQVRAVQNGCLAVPSGSKPSCAALTCVGRSRRTTCRPLRTRASRRTTSTRRVVGHFKRRLASVVLRVLDDKTPNGFFWLGAYRMVGVQNQKRTRFF